MSKRPAFQFYPGDWRTDPGLRLCSLLARGLWIEMMAIMHEGEPYGHLTAQGRAISDDMLARLVGEGAAAVKRAIKDLEVNGVFSRTDAGVIYSRRMVRDEAIREARAAGGSLGKGHGEKGASHGTKGGRPRKDKPPLGDDVMGVILPPPSSSSPSPSSFVDDDGDAGEIDIQGLTDELARMARVRHVDPGRIGQHVDLVREWIGHGATPDDMRAAVREGVTAASAAIHSLKYFSGAVRLKVAKRENDHGSAGQGSAAEQSGDGILRAAADRRARRRAGQPD
ncbi:hypothetical protein [Sphingobium sp. RAC03]|uniref:hypothetical protein n=1 Tax=Sphingobium sp. RAC03 TaxID=1843368 RepID=UPI0012372B68|nr:hypothetical protein [Sphingobium sp. RAC03]